MYVLPVVRKMRSPHIIVSAAVQKSSDLLRENAEYQVKNGDRDNLEGDVRCATENLKTVREKKEKFSVDECSEKRKKRKKRKFFRSFWYTTYFLIQSGD